MLKREDQKKKLIGAYASVYTPATDDGLEIDFERYREQIHFIVDTGFSEGIGTLMAAGGAAEGYMLSETQWRRAVETCAEVAAGRVPLVAGVFGLGSRGVMDRIEYAEELGYSFVQLVPPANQGPTDTEIYEYYALADSVSHRIGILVYHSHWNWPGPYELTLPLLNKIVDLEHVVGIKWSGKSMMNFLEVIGGLKDKVAFTDNFGWVTKSRDNGLGFRMFMAPAVNWDPEGVIRVSKLWQAGDYPAFAAENRRIAAPKAAMIRAAGEELHGQATLANWDSLALRLVKSLGEGTVNKGIMELVGRPLGPPFKPQHRVSNQCLERAKELLAGSTKK